MIDVATQLAIIDPDAEQWDAFVSAHPHGHLLQSCGWAELKGRFGWQWRRVAVAGPDGLLAGAQVLMRRRFGMAVAYVPRGPLFSGDSAVDRLLLNALERIARRARAVFLRLEPNVLENTDEAMRLHSALLLHGMNPAEPLQPRSSIHLDLRPAPDKLLAAMSKGHKADIKRAAREGVQVRVGETAADLDIFYSIMEATSARAAFGIHSKAYYAAAWNIFRADDAALLLIAEHGSAPVATALVAAWAGEGLYLYSGSTPEGLKSGAQHAIQWQALQWAREHGCRLYDFWGIPDALGQAAMAPDEAERERLEAEARNDELFGVYRFKKGFGGQIVRYIPAYDQVFMPVLYRLWQQRFGA
jgi:lipid II:glycine glycyltransferase (peptidoglycan interpeptide bridge formation enzyme)